MNELFTPTTLGQIEVPTRIAMAPMTRSRAIDGVPGRLHVEYYSQRASAGLIVTEGTAPSPSGLGYARTPGIFTEEQIGGWKRVTDAVHAAGGTIVLQMMHVGRIAHPLNQPAGARIVAPSAIAAAGEMWTDKAGKQPLPVPEELTAEEIRGIIREFYVATENARRAGFDGVELHAANGYLPNQFLSPNSNQRTDAYGGSVEHRARFVLELFDSMSAAWANDRIGVRVSPFGTFNDMLDTDPRATYTYLAKQLSQRGAAFLHVIRPEQADFDVWRVLRESFQHGFLANGGVGAREATDLIRSGLADVISFGRPFISNPDFPARLRNGWPLTSPQVATFYSAGPEGYTDYTRFQPEAALASA